MAKYFRDYLVWLLIVTGVFIFLTPLNLYRQIGMPFGGFITGISPQQKNWFMNTATPSWWSGYFESYFSGKEVGSIVILEINRQEFGLNALELFQEVEKEAQNHGQEPVVELQIARGKEIVNLLIPVVRFSFDDFLDIALPNFINSFCYLIIGWGIFLLRPNEERNRVFAIVCSLIALNQSLTRPSAFHLSNEYAWVASFLWSLTAPLGVVIIHFAGLFPTYQISIKARKLLQISYLLMFFVGAAFAMSNVIFALEGFSDLAAFLDRWGVVSLFAVVWIGWVLFILNNIHHYRSSHQNQKQRTQIKIVLFSTALAVLYVAPVSLQYFFNTLFFAGLDTRYFLLSIPLGFAIISLRYDSFRSTRPPIWLLIPLIITMSAIFASFTSWLWWRLAPEIGRPLFAQVFLIALSVTLVWSILTSARGFLVRILNWETISYAMVQQFGQRLVGTTDLRSLPFNMAKLLHEMLHLERVAIWFWNEESAQLELVSSLSEIDNLPHELCLPADLKLAYSQPYRLGDEKSPASTWLETFVDLQNWNIAMPLGIDRPVGLILLGARADGEIFDERDLTILALMARQATLFVFSAQVTYWLDKAQEDERFRIAQDLHDTIQQSLHAVSIHLHMIQKMARRDVEHTALYALECQNDIKDAIRNLYEIRRSLDPNELAQGLVEPVRMAVDRAKRLRGLNTHILASPKVDEGLSPPARRALYRMIKQALDNTLAHANASNFHVQLEKENQKVRFVIADDGQGSTTEQRNLALSSGHMGLKTMRTRIESLGGEFTYHSQPGAGTQISGWVPAAG